MNSLGDMAQAFASSRNNHDIKTRLFRLTNELSTGRVEDLSAHLRGDTKKLADLDRRITVGGAQFAGVQSAGQTFAVMQLALGRVNGAREELATALGTLSLESNSLQTGMAADAGRIAFESIVNALNTRLADQSLFSGATTDRQALTDPATMLDELRGIIAGLTAPADVRDAIANWFTQPGGGFETSGYQGDTGPLPTRRIDEETTVTMTARADDPAIRELLTATAIAALSDDPNLQFSDRDRGELIETAKIGVLVSAAPMVHLQAEIGSQEARIENANVRISAQISALTIMRNQMTGADPFETASRLEQVQVQLETHYTVTARLSRLSLAEYLR